MMPPPTPLAGDVLLYRPSSIFGQIIRIKTWHRISHVEIAIGGGQSVASRDGLGVNQYSLRVDGLAHVLRPVTPFLLDSATRWFALVKGTPYGWIDLAAFMGLPWDSKGMFCSEFATQFLRCGGVRIFGVEYPRDIAPFEFLLADCLTPIWSDGQKD